MNSILTFKQIDAYGRHLRDEERAPANICMAAGVPRVAGRAGADAENRCTVEGRAAGRWPVARDVNVMLSALNGLCSFLGMPERRVRFLKVQRRVFRDASRELTQAEYARLLDTAARQRGRTGQPC